MRRKPSPSGCWRSGSWEEASSPPRCSRPRKGGVSGEGAVALMQSGTAGAVRGADPSPRVPGALSLVLIRTPSQHPDHSGGHRGPHPLLRSCPLRRCPGSPRPHQRSQEILECEVGYQSKQRLPAAVSKGKALRGRREVHTEVILGWGQESRPCQPLP